MSRSWVEVLVAYRRERLPAPLYLSFATFIAVAGQASNEVAGSSRAASFGYAWLLALALIVQFRIWDDLADRERDRREHPERTLVRAPSRGPLCALCLAAAAAAAVLLAVRAGFRPSPDVVGYAILCAAYGAWYAGLRREVPRRVLSAHLVLLKYPVFTLLIAGGWPPRETGGVAAVAVYGCVCVDELCTDARLRSAHAILAIDMAVLLSASLAFFSKVRTPLAFSVQVVVVLALGVTLAAASRRARTGRIGRVRAAPFALTSLGIMNILVDAPASTAHVGP